MTLQGSPEKFPFLHYFTLFVLFFLAISYLYFMDTEELHLPPHRSLREGESRRRKGKLRRLRVAQELES